MPRVSKKRVAAKERWQSRRLTHQPTADLLLPPPAPVDLFGPETGPNLELPPDEELLSTIEVNIKEEPREDMEFEVELIDPKFPHPPGETLDPIGQEANQKLFPEEKKTQRMARCQFCLEKFRIAKERKAIARLKIEFVLGWRGWGTPGSQPVCCKGCRKMFELFYEFKRSCLAALSRPAELLAGVEADESADEIVDHKPRVRMAKEPKEMEESKNEQCEESNVNTVQETEACGGLEGQLMPEYSEARTPSVAALPEDLQQDVKEPNFECQICMVKFSSGSALKEHWLTHFSTTPDTTVTSSAVQEALTNPLIPEVYLSFPALAPSNPIVDARLNTPAPEPDLSTAETEDEEQKRTYCARCRKWFPTKIIYVHHKPFCIKYKERPEPAFACTQCPQKFRRENDLSLHINKHNGVRTIPCRREGCTKMFFNMKRRGAHEKLCGQEAGLICSVCGSLFKSLGILRMHMDAHGDPKYSCDICQKTFHRKANLKKHAASHSDERKFECKVCGKRFKSHEANRVHQRIHTQERPYPCHICGQRFMYNCLLKTHLEKGHDTVPGPNPFSE